MTDSTLHVNAALHLNHEECVASELSTTPIKHISGFGKEEQGLCREWGRGVMIDERKKNWTSKKKIVEEKGAVLGDINKSLADKNWHLGCRKWDNVHQAGRDSVHWREKKGLKNEKEICGQQSEGHEMNRAQRPSGVCPGDMWGLDQGQGWAVGAGMVQAGSIEPAKEKKKTLTRAISLPIVAPRITQEGAVVWICTEGRLGLKSKVLFWLQVIRFYFSLFFAISSNSSNLKNGTCTKSTFIAVKCILSLEFLRFYSRLIVW